MLANNFKSGRKKFEICTITFTEMVKRLSEMVASFFMPCKFFAPGLQLQINTFNSDSTYDYDLELLDPHNI